MTVFDVEAQGLQPALKVTVILILMSALLLWTLMSKAQLHAKAVGVLLALGFTLLGGIEYFDISSRLARIRAEVDRGSVRTIAGVFQVTGNPDSYQIGSEAFVISERNYPAFWRDQEWIVEHLESRCVAARYTSHREIIWLRVDEGAC